MRGTIQSATHQNFVQILRRLFRHLPLQLAGLRLRDVLLVGAILEGYLGGLGEQLPHQHREREDVTFDGAIVILEALRSHPPDRHQLVLELEVLLVVLVPAQAGQGDLGRKVTADDAVAGG